MIKKLDTTKIFIFIKGVKVYGTDRQRTTGVY